MHRRVELTNAYGDVKHGIERQGRSDMPATITSGATHWYSHVWEEHGWTVTWEGEWEW